MEQVEWMEDLDHAPGLSDEELVNLLVRRMPGRSSDWCVKVVDDFRGCLEAPDVGWALSRSILGEAADVEVRREWVWLGEAPTGGARSGIIDRVVMVREAGIVRRAVVIDWKTDRVPPGGHGEWALRYREQLNGYRSAVSGLTGLAVEDVTAFVVFLRDGVSVELGSDGDSSDSEG